MNNIQLPEFKSYEEEAAFWDNLDTADMMEDDGEWFHFDVADKRGGNLVLACTEHSRRCVRDDMTKVLSYRTVLRKEEEGGYTVIVPSLPGCVTYGETVDHAITMAKEAIELYVQSLQAHGEEIPTDAETLEYTLMIPAYA